MRGWIHVHVQSEIAGVVTRLSMRCGWTKVLYVCSCCSGCRMTGVTLHNFCCAGPPSFNSKYPTLGSPFRHSPRAICTVLLDP